MAAVALGSIPAVPAAALAGVLASLGRGLVYVLGLGLLVAWGAGYVKTFRAAGLAGTDLLNWNGYQLMCQLTGRSYRRAFLLSFVPVLNLLVWYEVHADFAQRFGRSRRLGLLCLLPFVYFPILGFGDVDAEGGGREHFRPFGTVDA